MADITEATCKLAVEALKTPEFASLSDAYKQQLVAACELVCGGACPSDAEQDRAICLFSFFFKGTTLNSRLE